MSKRKRSNSSDNFYKKKHKRLDTIALIAKNLAWLALIVGVLVAIGQYIQTKTYLEFQVMQMSFIGNDVSELLNDRPLFSLSLMVDTLNILIKGVIYAVVLKGISLALYMLIEIDLNYSLMNEDGE